MKRFRLVPLLLASLPSLALAGDTQDAAPAPSEPTAAQEMRVYIDPETGELTHQPVTDEQRRDAAAEAEQHRHDGENARVVRHADGSITGYLDGQFEQASVAVVDSEGRFKTQCADADHADRGRHEHPELAPTAAAERDER